MTYEVDTAVIEIVNHSAQLYKNLVFYFKEWAAGRRTPYALQMDVMDALRSVFPRYAGWCDISNTRHSELMVGLIAHYAEQLAGLANRTPDWVIQQAEDAFPITPAPPAPKFNAGDRVEVNNSALKSHGWVGTVVSSKYVGSLAVPAWVYEVDMEHGQRGTSYKEGNLELVYLAPAKKEVVTLDVETNFDSAPPRFKVGDKVKYVGSDSAYLGETGVVETNPNSIGGCNVRLDSTGNLAPANTCRLAHYTNAVPKPAQEEVITTIQFKPGDRVRVVAAHSMFHNQIGTIKRVAVAVAEVMLDGNDIPCWFKLEHITHNLEVPTQQEQHTMAITSPAFENKTFVLGQDAAGMNDEQLYSAITQVGAEIERLSKVTPAPKKLVARIEELKAQQQQIVDLVDSRG